MGNILIDEDLCVALSGLFVGTAIDYEYIASVAKNYPIDFVEKNLFKYVAPACNYNTTWSDPIVIYLFDKKDLLMRIEKIKTKNKSKLGKIYLELFSFYLRIKFKPEWKMLKNHYYA